MTARTLPTTDLRAWKALEAHFP
ncbi:MAG: hypothetical protein H6Q01_1005, partial [Acidobacteria bacterium]|nr:hypothetical protein [Acidobacteriota bacterium]